MPIKNLPVTSRPREKAQINGIETLSDIELLAILIGNGTTKKDALDISKSLFEKFSLKKIGDLSLNELRQNEGIGNVKAIEIQAIFELSKRIFNSYDHTQNTVLDTSAKAALFAQSVIGNSPKEQFLVMLIDKKMQLINHKIMYSGTKKHLSIDTNEILSYVLKHDVTMFYCSHNHPSGDLSPSIEDVSETLRMHASSKLLGIKLIKHLIVSKSKDFREITFTK